MPFLRRLLTRAQQRDGQAPALQATALATGAALAAALPPDAALQVRRCLPPPDRQLLEGLSAKVLAGWIQNRHQTLYPLAMNFRSLPPGVVPLLLAMAAVALRIQGEPGEAELERVRAWFATAGGGSEHERMFAEALAHPRPLHDLLGEVATVRLGPQAYAVALAVLDQRPQVNRLFLDYLAARLAIPSDVARSLAQRYRL